MHIKKGLQKAVTGRTARFFMPGHKGTLHPYDVTEIPGTDNLHQPEDIILRAQQFVAQTVGAQHSFFSVGGSTAGIHALILSVCGRGDTLIVDRSCHISVINIITMMDITPVFLYPTHNQAFGISSGIQAADVAAALTAHPHAKGVLITSPTYYGVCSDLASIAQETHKRGVPLLVDEAHGAHFPFHPKLPASALSCGADGVVQSTHKTLPSLTQSAVVHVNSPRIPLTRLKEHLKMLQTTSPSYLLMDSIEQSFWHMAKKGQASLDKLITRCDRLRQALDQTGLYQCLSLENCGGFAYDPTRLVIHIPGGTQNAGQMLQDRFQVVVEMDDGFNLVCIPTVCNSKGDFRRLYKTLLQLSKELPPHPPCAHTPPPRTRLICSPHTAFYGETEAVPPQQAIGRIAARSVYQTPPCMPILCPGEQVTEGIAACLTGEITIVK